MWSRMSRSIDLLQWRPDLRELKTHSSQGGTLRLSEQYYPGWKTTVDGAEVRIENCDTALQCITVPAGGRTHGRLPVSPAVLHPRRPSQRVDACLVVLSGSEALASIAFQAAVFRQLDVRAIRGC